MGSGATSYILTFLSGIITAGLFLSNKGEIHQNYHGILSILLLTIISILIFINIGIYRKVFRKEGSPRIQNAFIIIGYLAVFLAGICNLYIRSPHVDKKQMDYFSNIKTKIITHINNTVKTPNESAVMTALITGDRNELSKEVKDNYKKSGAMHMLALSGMHIGIIYAMISNVLFIFGINYKGRVLRLIITFVFLSAYTAMTGFSPSAMRAAIMISIYSSIRLLNIRENKIRILAMSAIVIALYDPYELFKPGFQLSFAAMIGILYIYPYIGNSYKIAIINAKTAVGKHLYKIFGYVWSITAISISCQITTLPISYFYFQSLPDNYLITNIAAIPILTAVMYTFPITVIGLFIPFISNTINEILTLLLKILNSIIAFMS